MNDKTKDSPENNVIRSADKKLTITDVAKLAGVSKKTVSRVINRSGLVKDETRDRIMKVVEEHGYTPDPLHVVAANRPERDNNGTFNS